MEKVELQENGEVAHKTKVHGQNQRCFWIIAVVLLALTVIALLAIVIALAVVQGTTDQGTTAQGSTDQGPTSEDVCLTDGCIQLSAQVAASLNQSVDPCEDFYQFACGNWLRTNIIESGQSLKIRLFDGVDQINIFLRKILESGDDGGVTAVRKAIDLYSSCINTAQIDARGAQPMIDILNATGGWSLVGIDESEPWSINSTTGFIYEKNHGSNAFFEISFDIDDMNSSVWIPSISQAGTTLVRFDVPILIDAYKNLIVTVLSLLYPDGDQSSFEEAAESIISMERQLSAIQVSPTALRDLEASYNPVLLKDISGILPEFDWQTLFTSGGYMFSDTQVFLVRTPTYFRNLSVIIQSTNTTTLRDYSKWRLVWAYLNYLSADFRDALQVFNGIAQGVQGEPQRSDICISFVQSTLPIALARPFVEQYVPAGTKETVSMMISWVKEAFKNRIMELGEEWLDELSEQRSIAKVDAITEMVAYPDQIFDNDYVNGISETYMVDPSDYFGNFFNTWEFNLGRNIRRTMEGIDKTRWFEDFLYPTDINAAYAPSLNQFIFLAGILRHPLFDARWPEYFNFGSLGYVIGHELTHGFDDQGQQFDKDGIRQQWWTTESITAFQERQTCFVEQYNQFTIGEAMVPVNGEITLGENIADNGGVNTAFKAYRNRVENEGATQQRLPSLPYSTDQLFFIASGQVWCAIYTPEILGILGQVSVHSPGPARVVGPLTNSEDFAKVFNCKVGSPMNPPVQDKCVIW